jgi:3-methylcrotonyl-CoA carboxylase alpha subunit
MASAGVPVVPGYHGDNQEDDFLQEEAHRVGFPLLVKAVMGGGGKGMKLATKAEEFMVRFSRVQFYYRA